MTAGPQACSAARPPTAADILPAARDFVVQVLGQGRVLARIYPGVMHFLLFWGMTVQVLGTAVYLMQMQLFVPFVELSFPRGSGYLAFELTMDLAGAAVLAGVLMAAVRRWLLRPKTLETRWDDAYALALLSLLPAFGFSTEALRFVSVSPAWEVWSPAGHLLLRANGDGAWFGWPNSPALEALRDEWFEAPTPEAQKAIGRRIQAQFWQDLPYWPIGQYFVSSAWRTSLTGVLKGMVLPLNVRRV